MDVFLLSLGILAAYLGYILVISFVIGYLFLGRRGEEFWEGVFSTTVGTFYVVGLFSLGYVLSEYAEYILA